MNRSLLAILLFAVPLVSPCGDIMPQYVEVPKSSSAVISYESVNDDGVPVIKTAGVIYSNGIMYPSAWELSQEIDLDVASTLEAALSASLEASVSAATIQNLQASIAQDRETANENQARTASQISALQQNILNVQQSIPQLPDLSGYVTAATLHEYAARASDLAALQDTQEDFAISLAQHLDRIEGHDSAIQTLEGSIQELDAAYSSMETAVSQCESDISGLDARTSSLESDNLELNTRVGITESNIGILQTSVTALDNLVNECQSDISGLSDDVSTISSDLAALTARVDAIPPGGPGGCACDPSSYASVSNLNALAERVTTAESSLQDHLQDYSSLNTKVRTDHEGRIVVLESQYSSLTNAAGVTEARVVELIEEYAPDTLDGPEIVNLIQAEGYVLPTHLISTNDVEAIAGRLDDTLAATLRAEFAAAILAAVGKDPSDSEDNANAGSYSYSGGSDCSQCHGTVQIPGSQAIENGSFTFSCIHGVKFTISL